MSPVAPATRRLAAFLACDRGATAIEYAVIASGIAIAIAALVFVIGGAVVDSYEAVADGMAG